MKLFVSELVMDMAVDNGNIQVGLLTYGNGPSLAFHLDTYSSRKELVEAIVDVKYTHGSTNAADALK